jgi:hypothetical protein
MSAGESSAGAHLVEQGREHGGHGEGDQPAIAGAEHIDLGLHSKALQHGNQALGLKRLRAAGVGGGGLSEEDEVRAVDGELRLQEGLQLQLPRRHALPPEPMHQHQRRTSRGGARRNPAVHDGPILQANALRLHPQALEQAPCSRAASLHGPLRHRLVADDEHLVLYSCMFTMCPPWHIFSKCS